MKLNNNDDSHNSGLNLLIYNMLLDIESHPAWVCGLKLHFTSLMELELESHPAWVCGLKHGLIRPSATGSQVTPCVGVWIETSRFKAQCRLTVSHPAWVCGLKRTQVKGRSMSISHTLRGCVD